MKYYQRVRKLRERLGLTQEKLARQADLGSSYISRLENGEVESPGYAVAEKIAHALGVTVGVLMGETEPPEVETPPLNQVAEDVVTYLPGAPSERVVNLLSRTPDLPPESIARMLGIIEAIIEQEEKGYKAT